MRGMQVYFPDAKHITIVPAYLPDLTTGALPLRKFYNSFLLDDVNGTSKKGGGGALLLTPKLFLLRVLICSTANDRSCRSSKVSQNSPPVPGQLRLYTLMAIHYLPVVTCDRPPPALAASFSLAGEVPLEVEAGGLKLFVV